MATTLQLPNIRHFFKVMMPGFLTELWLPPKFCRRMINGEKWEKAVLKSGRGSWDVKVSRNSEGRLHLKEGWTAFVKHHKLCIGDFIVFEHKGDMVFHVLLFDKSGYENDYPLPVDAALNNHKRTGFQGQGNTHNHAKRFKGQSPVEVATSGSSAPHCPHFKTTIKACNIPPTTPYLNIPTKFARSNDLTNKSSVTLMCPLQKLWTVKLYKREWKSYSQVCFKQGWHEFAMANQLKKGDVCIFELDSTRTTTTTVVLDVRIFPALM